MLKDFWGFIYGEVFFCCFISDVLDMSEII